MEIFLLILIIVILSIVQSILGIGLLLFGTPSLLLLGYNFIDSLIILLPPSIIISLLQIINNKETETLEISAFKRKFNYYCIPFLLIGLFVVKLFVESINFTFLIGTILIIISVVRSHTTANYKFSNFLYKNNRLGNIFIGITHGLTNMGGSFLSVLSASTFPNNKALIRYAVAYCYFIMGIVQFLFIAFLFPIQLSYTNILYVFLSALVFSVFGEKLFASIQNYQYQKLITILIFFYGILLLINPLIIKTI